MKNRKIFTKLTAHVLSLGLVLSGVMSLGTPAEAAKKVALSKKSLTVTVGKVAKLSVKNANKKSKIVWSSKSSKIAKVTKSGKTGAKVKGIKAGKTTVTAKYKSGKTQKKLNCKVTVKAASTNNDQPQTQVSTAPIASAAASAAPAASAAAKVSAAPSSSDAASSAPAGATEGAPAKQTEAAAAHREHIKAGEIPKLDEENEVWLTTWGTAEEKADGADGNAKPKMDLKDTTIRQIVKVTNSGKVLKFRLSNQYGGEDVVVGHMHIAKQVDADDEKIDTKAEAVVTVGGKENFTIPKGKLIETDPVSFDVKALENIAVSMYFESAPTKDITGHRGARATTWQTKGDAVDDIEFPTAKAVTTTTTGWYFLADVSVRAPKDVSAGVVCFGDSITDGYGTDASYLGKKPNSYTRWGDYFAKRLQANEKTKYVSVINEGIGANSILGSYPTDAGKDRFERDITQHDNVKYCIILFGVNDLEKLSDTKKFDQLKPEYEKMVEICHKNNVKCYGAPILPFGTSSYYSESSEAVRKMINDWMRSSASGMDGIIDFENALLDPSSNPPAIKEEYTHSDGLHPYDGYDVMANAIDLNMFDPTAEPAKSSGATPLPVDPNFAEDKWLTTWGTAEEKVDISADQMPPFDKKLADTTVRQAIKVTTAGKKIKFRLSNQYGGKDVVVKSMHIAKQVDPEKSTIDKSTDTVVTVGGSETFTLTKKTVVETDAINFNVNPLDCVAISMYFESAPTSNITGHRGARATTWHTKGNAVSEETFSDDANNTKTTKSWFFIADASVMAPESAAAVVCFGDSITDGYGTDADYLGKKPNMYTRWGDYFAKRLQANEKTRFVSVINEGIGSNGFFGAYPSDAGEKRFKRDLTEHDGVKYCIILFGVNNMDKLKDTKNYDKMKKEYEKMISTCHDNNIKCHAAPILPFGKSSYYSAKSEELRTMLNTWMRSAESGFDGIIDFESAVMEPGSNPPAVKEEYTHEDGLHPYDGYEAMANAIDLKMFEG